MPACGRFDVKYNRTVPGQLVLAGHPPFGLPMNIVVDGEVKTCITAFSVLLVVRLAVKPLVNRFA